MDVPNRRKEEVINQGNLKIEDVKMRRVEYWDESMTVNCPEGINVNRKRISVDQFSPVGDKRLIRMKI